MHDASIHKYCSKILIRRTPHFPAVNHDGCNAEPARIRATRERASSPASSATAAGLLHAKINTLLVVYRKYLFYITYLWLRELERHAVAFADGQIFSESSRPRDIGGSVHTPFGWSLVSFGFAFTSDFSMSLKPAFSASAITYA